MRKLFAFLVLLAACLTLSGCLMVRIESIETPEEEIPTATEVPTFTPVPTNTIVWFPPTATPRPLNTPTPFPTVDQLPALGKALLSDDFSSEETWQTFRSEAGNAVISNNELTLSIQKSVSAIASYSTLPQLGDYYLSLDVSLSLCTAPSDWYGVAFRVNDSANTYRWLFNCLGETRVDRLYKGRSYLISDWDINGQIKPSAPQKFRIGIAARGSELSFYANDVLLTTAEDTLFQTGGYGLLAASEGSGLLTVSFSDFKLTALR